MNPIEVRITSLEEEHRKLGEAIQALRAEQQPEMATEEEARKLADRYGFGLEIGRLARSYLAALPKLQQLDRLVAAVREMHRADPAPTLRHATVFNSMFDVYVAAECENPEDK